MTAGIIFISFFFAYSAKSPTLFLDSSSDIFAIKTIGLVESKFILSINLISSPSKLSKLGKFPFSIRVLNESIITLCFFDSVSPDRINFSSF